MDIVVTNEESNSLSVFLGNGDGTFSPRFDYPGIVDPLGLALGDVNEDGSLDAVVSDFSQNTVSVFLNDGQANFDAGTTYPTGDGPSDIKMADLNGDHHLDLAVSNLYDGTISVLPGDGTRNFGPKTDSGYGGGCGLDIADVTDDGLSDAVTTGCMRNEAVVLVGNGTFSFPTRRSYPAGTRTVDVVAADLDQDGRTDLVVSNFQANSVSLLLQRNDLTVGGVAQPIDIGALPARGHRPAFGGGLALALSLALVGLGLYAVRRLRRARQLNRGQ